MGNPEPTTWQTARLLLRPWRESDAEALYRYASNPRVGPMAGWPPHASIENSRAIIRTILAASETYAIVLRDTGEAIGSIGLITAANDMTCATVASNECEMGFWLGEPFWGRGLMVEAIGALLRHAFNDLHLMAVWCGYYEGNEQSRRAQEKSGFVYHHSVRNLRVVLLREVRTAHFSRLTLEHWRELQSQQA